MAKLDQWQFSAPGDIPELTIILPTPAWGNTEQPLSSVAAKTDMDGGLITNVKKQPNSFQYDWTFELTRMKSLELAAFYKLYGGGLIRVETHTGETLIGYMKINPLTYSVVGRGVISTSREFVQTSIEFEKVQ